MWFKFLLPSFLVGGAKGLNLMSVKEKANIAKLLHNREFRDSLENAEDAAAIQQIISQPTE